MDFRNATALDGDRLYRLLLRHTAPYRHDSLKVAVRYSRGADFSGTCYYRHAQIYVNLGEHLRFPYQLGTNVAKARSNHTHWWRETYYLTVTDAYQLVLFVYLHELYHHLVKQAGRSPRLKESRCDRFAARVLVDDYGCAITDSKGRPVSRTSWDFQDLDRLVAKAPRVGQAAAPAPPRTQQIPVRVYGLDEAVPRGGLLFDM